MTPTLQRDADTGEITVLDPPELAGRQVVEISGSHCLIRFDHRSACGLVRNHEGECWQFADELIATSGPWAVKR